MSTDVEALIYGEVDRDEMSHISYYESVFCCHPESALMQRIPVANCTASRAASR